jgi:hypothetical protein
MISRCRYKNGHLATEKMPEDATVIRVCLRFKLSKEQGTPRIDKFSCCDECRCLNVLVCYLFPVPRKLGSNTTIRTQKVSSRLDNWARDSISSGVGHDLHLVTF